MRRLTAADIYRGDFDSPCGNMHCAAGWVMTAEGGRSGRWLPDFRNFLGVVCIAHWNDNPATPKTFIADMLNRFFEAQGLLPPSQAEIDTVLEESSVPQETEKLCVA